MSMTACIRCGKPRILDKTWKEQIGLSKVTYTSTVCPDPICQKLVETLLQERHDVNDARMKASVKRREENRKKGMEMRKAKNSSTSLLTKIQAESHQKPIVY